MLVITCNFVSGKHSWPIWHWINVLFYLFVYYSLIGYFLDKADQYHRVEYITPHLVMLQKGNLTTFFRPQCWLNSQRKSQHISAACVEIFTHNYSFNLSLKFWCIIKVADFDAQDEVHYSKMMRWEKIVGKKACYSQISTTQFIVGKRIHNNIITKSRENLKKNGTKFLFNFIYCVFCLFWQINYAPYMGGCGERLSNHNCTRRTITVAGAISKIWPWF